MEGAFMTCGMEPNSTSGQRQSSGLGTKQQRLLAHLVSYTLLGCVTAI